MGRDRKKTVTFFFLFSARALLAACLSITCSSCGLSKETVTSSGLGIERDCLQSNTMENPGIVRWTNHNRWNPRDVIATFVCCLAYSCLEDRPNPARVCFIFVLLLVALVFTFYLLVVIWRSNEREPVLCITLRSGYNNVRMASLSSVVPEVNFCTSDIALF